MQPMKKPLLARPLLAVLGMDARKAIAAACDRFNGEVDVSELVPAEGDSPGSVARPMASIMFHSTAVDQIRKTQLPTIKKRAGWI